jgi:hypothetical protein
MDWHIWVAIASGAVQLYALRPYIGDMLHGTTRPNAVTWFVWDVLAVIEIFAQINAGAYIQSLILAQDECWRRG